MEYFKIIPRSKWPRLGYRWVGLGASTASSFLVTDPPSIFLISAGCIFGGAVLGLFLSGLFPESHLRCDRPGETRRCRRTDEILAQLSGSDVARNGTKVS